MELINDKILVNTSEVEKGVEVDEMLKPHLERSPERSPGVSSSNNIGLLDHQKLMIATDDDDDEISCPFKDSFGKSSLSDIYCKCEKCGRLFTDQETLEMHVKSKHPDRSVVKKHKCDFCSYSSNNVCNVKAHMRTHTKEKPFKCSICSKTFSQKTNFKTHLRTHTDDPTHECSHCGYKFTRLSDLKKHKRTVHEKLRSFVCEICGSMFGRNPDYEKHMLIHANAKAYKCSLCPAAFNHSNGLRGHIITRHTREFPHRCSLCGKGFMVPNQLKKHSIRCSKK